MPIQWTRKNSEDLIALYKKHECLWDPRHPGYVDRTRREKSFNIIRSTMKKTVVGLTLADLKSKVLSLRSQFRKEFRTIIASRRNGTKSSDIRTPKLWCYSLLEFLIPSLKTNDNTSKNPLSQLQYCDKITKKEQEELSDGNESFDGMDEQPSTPCTSKETPEQRPKRTVNDFESEICQLAEFLEKKAERKYEWLGEQVVQTLNEMTNQDVIDETILMLQRQIMESKIKDRTNVVYTEAEYN